MIYRLGIDLGGTAVKAGIVDENFNIVKNHKVKAHEGLKNVVKDIVKVANEVAEMVGIRVSDIPCAGIGTPGFTNPETGRLVYSANLNLEDVPLAAEIEKELGIPVLLGNDANCAVIGETLAGAAKGFQNVVLITLGTGLGGGIIYNGKLFIGGHGMGAEVGHMPIVTGGERCTCGIYGCYEAYGSTTALIRQAKEAAGQHPESSMNKVELNGRTIFDCAHACDKTALEVVDQYEEYVAAGLGGLISVFRPDIALIGGGISGEGEYLVGPIREKLPKYVFASQVIGIPAVKTAELGNAAGTIGAAYLDWMY